MWHRREGDKRPPWVRRGKRRERETWIREIGRGVECGGRRMGRRRVRRKMRLHEEGAVGDACSDHSLSLLVELLVARERVWVRAGEEGDKRPALLKSCDVCNRERPITRGEPGIGKALRRCGAEVGGERRGRWVGGGGRGGLVEETVEEGEAGGADVRCFVETSSNHSEGSK